MKIKLTASDTTTYPKSPINVLLAWVLLVIALTLTAFYTYSTKHAVEDNARKEFSFECDQIRNSVIDRLHAHAAVLRTGAAFIEACDTVTRKEWEVFIANQKTYKNLPGVPDLGYAMIVSGELIKGHEQHIRRSGFPGYGIKPEGERETYTSIVYIEPFSGRNLKAFGYDMFSDPVRREAMEKARDFDIASLSGKVKLVQESNTDIQTGTLMYVPVYRSGMPVNTLAERRRAIKGWSFSPYRMNDFMHGVLGNYEKLRGSIHMQIYDAGSVTPDNLMFDSESVHKAESAGPNILFLTLPVVFNGKTWTLHFSKVMEFSSFFLFNDVLLVLFGGIAVSFLIFMLALSFLVNRYRLKFATQLARNLKESLDKHIALYNAIPDAVFVTDSKTGRIEEVNKMASEQYDYTNDEFKSLLSSTLTLMPDSSENSGIRDKLYFHDTFHAKKDGTVFPVEITDSSFDINDEKKIISIARDITAPLNAKLELIKSKKRYQSLVENVSDAIVVSLPDKIAYANKRFFDFLGYSGQEVLSESYLRYIHPDDKDEFLAKYLNLFEGKSIHRYPARVIIKDGSIKWAEFSGIVIEWDGQKAVLSLIADITERKRAEESLLESHEIFSQFMLNSPIYVFFKDANIRSLRLSRNYEQMLGRPLQELIGKTMDEIFPSGFAKKMVADDLRILEEGKLTELEEELNGRFYATTKFPIYVDEKPRYLAGYTIDITGRKLADNTIKAALKEKEILLREVHHRVKNNLQVVSSLLNLQANNITDITIKEILEQSRNRIRSIALVHEKLYKTGNFAEINIKEYTHSLLTDLFRVYMADPQQILIRTEIQDVNIPLALAIPYALILNEIISNSLKYAFPKDHEPIQKPEIFVTLKLLPNKYMQLCAGDNGIGLPQNFQLKESLSLGLYLIRILSTEQLNGEIDIDNKKGTIFTITFKP